jgi:predicted RNA methylase
VPDASRVVHAPATTLAFDNAYRRVPSWETGRLQPVVERLLARGAITGAVLDAGCGTGRAAVRAAADGHDVVGLRRGGRAVALAPTR